LPPFGWENRAGETTNRLIRVQLRTSPDTGRLRRRPRQLKKPSAHPPLWCTNVGSPPPGGWQERTWRCAEMFATSRHGPVALTPGPLPSIGGGRGAQSGWSPAHRSARHRPTAPSLGVQGSEKRWGRIHGVLDRALRSLCDRFGDRHIRHRHHHQPTRAAIDDRDFDGPVTPVAHTMNTRGDFANAFRRAPERVTPTACQGAGYRGRFAAVCGPDSSMLLVSHRSSRLRACTPCPGSCWAYPVRGRMRGGAMAVDSWPIGQGFVARFLPAPVFATLGALAAKRRREMEGTEGKYENLCERLEDFRSFDDTISLTCETLTELPDTAREPVARL